MPLICSVFSNALHTYDLSISLFLNSQKLVDSRPNSSWVPSKPEKTKNDPLPCFIISSLSWISVIWGSFVSLFVLFWYLWLWLYFKISPVAHLAWLESQGEEVSGKWWRCHSLRWPPVHECSLPPDLSSPSHLSCDTKEGHISLSVSSLVRWLPAEYLLLNR